MNPNGPPNPRPQGTTQRDYKGGKMITAVLSSLIYALPVSFICAAQFFPFFCPEDVSVAPTVTALIVLAVCSAMRHGSLKIRLILAAVILALSTGLFFAVGKEERAEFFSERLWVLFVILIALAAYIVGELMASFRPIRLIAAASIFTLSIWLIIIENDPGTVTSCMFLTIILSVIIGEVEHYWKKEGNINERKHMVSILPFIILCALFVFASPSSDEPYDWPVSHRIWQFAKDTITKISQYFSSEDDYLDTQIGFSSGDSRISGDVDTDTDSEIMFTVAFTRKETPAINLAACGYNEFNGHVWTNSVDDEGIGRRHRLDNLETRAALLRSKTKNITDHMRLIEVKVTYSNLNTRYTLLPSKYQDMLSQGELLNTKTDNDNTVFAGKKGLGTTYGFSNTMLNKNHKEFIEFMSGTGEAIDEDTWYKTVSELFFLIKSENSYEEYLGYIDKINRNYCREVRLSDALREKLDRLYDGCSSPYEKMLRLEAVLSQFTYTTSPGPVPDYVDSPEDFLDWFMLKNPKGYCSHFATAMVLLARAEGLPARYVEGFAVPASTKGGTDVSDQRAHSWVEIYFKGFGFIPFDPTPGYVTDSVWQTSSERAEYLSTLSKGSLDAFINMDAVDTSEDLPEEEPVPEDELSQTLILIPALMVALLFPAALLLYRLIAKKRYNKLSTTEKAASLCHSNMRLLRFLGAAPERGETLSEFARREQNNYPEGFLSDFTSLYEILSYSDRPVTDEMLFTLMRLGRILNKTAADRRPVAFFFYKIFAA